MKPLKGSRHCFAHSADTAHQRKAASSRGGQWRRVPNASAPTPVASIADLQQHIGQALADVLQHDNTLRRAMVVARLVMAAAKIIEDAAIIHRLDEIEARLQTMERT